MEQGPFCEPASRSCSHDISRFMELEISLSCLQYLATLVYPKPIKPNSHSNVLLWQSSLVTCFTLAIGLPRFLVPQNYLTDTFMLPGNYDSCYVHPVIHTVCLQIGNNVIITDKIKSHNFNTYNPRN
jgi:hypothetical protein